MNNNKLDNLTEDEMYSVYNNLRIYEANLRKQNIINKNNYLKNQKNKINNILENDFSEIKREIGNINSEIRNKIILNNFPLGNQINAIQSIYNNQVISTIPIDSDNYQIMINNQCLTVYGKDKVLLKDCNKGNTISDSQKFSTQRIDNSLMANTYFGKKSYNSNILYPYNIFKSNLINQCLTINDDGIYLEPCSGDISKQHWKISSENNHCPS